MSRDIDFSLMKNDVYTLRVIKKRSKLNLITKYY